MARQGVKGSGVFMIGGEHKRNDAPALGTGLVWEDSLGGY